MHHTPLSVPVRATTGRAGGLARTPTGPNSSGTHTPRAALLNRVPQPHDFTRHARIPSHYMRRSHFRRTRNAQVSLSLLRIRAGLAFASPKSPFRVAQISPGLPFALPSLPFALPSLPVVLGTVLSPYPRLRHQLFLPSLRRFQPTLVRPLPLSASTVLREQSSVFSLLSQFI